MAQIRKMVFHVEVKSSAERFFQTYCNKQLMFPKMCPNLVKDMQLIKGDSANSVGSVIKWIYALAGNSSSLASSVEIEAIDEKNKSITLRTIDGGMLKLYSTFKFTTEVMETAQGIGASVKTTIEYEKTNDNVPEPEMYCNFASVFYKSIDSYLLNNL